jgi:hypothetical protein
MVDEENKREFNKLAGPRYDFESVDGSEGPGGPAILRNNGVS